MRRTFLWSKIHRVTVTGTDVDYEGSLSLDPNLMEAADIRPFEKVDVYDVNNGERFSTYLIPGEPGRRGLAPKQGAKPLVLPSSTFAGKHQEHLTIAALNYGYVTAKRGSVEAKGGVEAEFRISFGDLHTSFSFKEIMKEEKVDK